MCGWDAVNEAIARPEDFSSNLTATMTYQPGGDVGTFAMEGLGGKSHVLATADEPAHAMHRKALLPQLAAKRIRAFEPFIAETGQRLWNAHLAQGRIEWMGAMANRLPMMIVGRIIGVPDSDTDKLVRWGTPRPRWSRDWSAKTNSPRRHRRDGAVGLHRRTVSTGR